MQQMQAQQQQIQQLTNLVTGDRQAQQQQAQWNAVAQHLTSVENELRATNKYDDDAIGAIYNLMGPDGDLKAAATTYDSMIGNALSKYLAGKQGAAAAAPAPVAGGGVIPAAEKPADTSDPDAMHAKAMALVAQLDREAATS
jgi:hypothetical protein